MTDTDNPQAHRIKITLSPLLLFIPNVYCRECDTIWPPNLFSA